LKLYDFFFTGPSDLWNYSFYTPVYNFTRHGLRTTALFRRLHNRENPFFSIKKKINKVIFIYNAFYLSELNPIANKVSPMNYQSSSPYPAVEQHFLILVSLDNQPYVLELNNTKRGAFKDLLLF
jgi:hypothetical protein